MIPTEEEGMARQGLHGAVVVEIAVVLAFQRMASLHTPWSVSHWGFPVTMESCAAILEMSFSFRYGIILRLSHSSGRTILAKVNASLVKPIQMFKTKLDERIIQDIHVFCFSPEI